MIKKHFVRIGKAVPQMFQAVPAEAEIMGTAWIGTAWNRRWFLRANMATANMKTLTNIIPALELQY